MDPTALPPMSGAPVEPVPHVEFFLEPVEDRTATINAGRKIMIDQEFYSIYPRGGKDVVTRKVPPPSEPGSYPKADRIDFEGKYGRHYGAWKEGREAPVEGTDLRNFPLLTPAEIENCRTFHIHSVEHLAAATEEALNNLGMGARNLKKTAQKWLDFGENGGKTIAQLQDLEEKVKAQSAQIETLTEKLQDKVAAQEEKPKPGRKKRS